MQRLTGIDLFRSIQAAGGLWTQASISEVTGQNIKTVGAWHRRSGGARDRFPKPCAYLRFTLRNNPLFAGNDVLTWLEAEGRFASAEKMAAAIAVVRQKERYGSSNVERYATAHAGFGARQPDSDSASPVEAGGQGGDRDDSAGA